MNKRILVLLMAFVLALSVAGLVACGSALDITIEPSSNGTVTADVNKAESGDEVTLTLTPDAGYYAEKVLVNDVEQQIDGNKCVFVMPNSNASVSVTFAEIKYSVNIAKANGGQITAKETSCKSGASVTLDVMPAYGYELQSLTVDGQNVTVTNNAYTFTMPSHDVEVSAVFDTDIQMQAMPQGSVATLRSVAPAGAAATADLFLSFGDDALTVTAYVQDNTVISSKDGIFLYFGKNVFANGKVSEANLAIKAYADKTVVIQQGSDNGYVGYSVNGVTVNVEPWSRQENVVNGYIVSISVSYQTLNVSKATAQSELTMLPVLANSDRTGIAFGASETSFDEYYSAANADTYPLVSENGFADNENMFGQGELGSFKDVVVMGDSWNNDRDYGKDSENYADRIVTLNGHDNADNNIAFTRSSGRTAFAKATFKVTSLYNSTEKYPKFGFMVYDTKSSNSGIFFYVDAYTDESKNSGIQVTDIIGTQLGYASQLNGGWRNDWTTISGTTNSFNLSTKQITLSILYNNGIISFFKSTSNGDVLVGGTAYQAQGNIVIGIKSFGLGLEVTGYMATNNPDNSEFKSHSAMRGDGQTIGDNSSGYAYTEGWTFYGDIAENTGGGDQVVYIKDVTASTDFYAQALVTSPSKVGNTNDEYTKVGAVIRNNNYTIFGYVDLEDRTSRENRILTNFAVRFESGSRAGQWIWEAGVSSRLGTTIEDKTVMLGIAKLGAKVYLTMNGKIVATYTNNDIAEQTFVAGVMGFNRSMTVTDGSGTTDMTQVKARLGLNTAESVKFDGVLDDDIWTEQVLNAKQTFGENEQLGTKMEIAAVKGSDGVYVALTLYTKTMQRHFAQSVAWSDVSNVEFRLTKMTDGNKGNKELVHYIAFYDYLDGAVGSSVGFLNATSDLEKIELKNGQQGYKTTIEFFVPFTYFVGSTAMDAELPFYVWTCTFDDVNMPAMNREYNSKDMVVTANGIVVRDRT